MKVLRGFLAIFLVTFVMGLSVVLDEKPAGAASTLCVVGVSHTRSQGYNYFSDAMASGLHFVSSVEFINTNLIIAGDKDWSWSEAYVGGYTYATVAFTQTLSGSYTGSSWGTFTC
jgi:hypothetical protein